MDISIDQICRIVSGWAVSHPEIERVLLFGSRARGDSKPSSDVDLALLVAGISGETAFTRYFHNKDDWKRELESALGRSVSIVCQIDHGRPEVQASIERDGLLLYERSSA